MDTEDNSYEYRKIPPPQSLKKRTLRTVLLKSWLLLHDVHVDAPVVEDTEIYDERPKKSPRQLRRGPSLQPKDYLRKRPNLMNPTHIHLMLKLRRTWQNGTGRMRLFING